MTIKVYSIVSNLLVLFLILLSGSMLHVGFFTPTYIVCFVFVVIVLLTSEKFPKKYLLRFATTLLFFTLFFCFNFVFSISKSFNEYRILIMQILLSLLIILCFQVRNTDFKYHLYNVLKIILVLSLIGFVLSKFEIGQRVSLGSGGFEVYTIYYLFYYSAEMFIGPIKTFRSQGIFWEAGVLAVYSNIFLLLSMFVYKSKRNTALAIACILSTLSTTGIFVMLIQFSFFMRKIKFSPLKKVLLAIALVPVMILVTNSFSEKKAKGDETAKSTYAVRSFDLYSGVMITLNNPLFGVGLNPDSFLSERNKVLTPEMDEIFSLIEERGNTNGLSMLFATLGIVSAFFLIIMLYKQDVFAEQRLLFLILTLCSLSSEPLQTTPFFLCFMVYGFQTTLKLKYK